MPTIGEVYNPLIKAAENNDPQGHALLDALADTLHQRYPDKSREQCLEQARDNLDYYCQYFGTETTEKVKTFYGLGVGFRGLNGEKLT